MASSPRRTEERPGEPLHPDGKPAGETKFPAGAASDSTAAFAEDAEAESFPDPFEKARRLVALELDLAETRRRLAEQNLEIAEAQLALAEQELEGLKAENQRLRREIEALRGC